MSYQSVFCPGLLADRVFVVTGGGSGIGRCTAHELAALGATPVLVGRTLAKLEGVGAGQVSEVAQTVPDPQSLTLEQLCERDAEGHYSTLIAHLNRCTEAAWRLSDALSARYFTHSGELRQSLGA